ncbi:MAG: ester cyclase [Candidatus Aminicenantes bacterium]|jgi:predicted ester cyclase
MNARKIILPVFAGFVLFASFHCQQKGDVPMSTEENKALVRRYAEEAFGKGSVAVSDELLSSDYVHHTLLPGITPDREGRKQLVSMLHAAFPDIRLTLEDMVAEGDKVAVRWTCSALHKGEYMGIAPTGKQVTWTGMSLHRVEGGKIVESWDEVDNLGMMQQFGVVPPPGQEK